MKKLVIVMAVLMLMGVMAGISPAAEKMAPKMEVLTGQVVDLDVQAGTIVIMANEKDQILKAEPKLLEGVAIGDKVNIEKSGNDLKSIKKTLPPAVE